MRQIDLEKYYSLTHPTTIGLIDQLEKKGFVCRKVNPEDARSRVIGLTEQALEMRKELERIGESLEEEFTAALTEDERMQLSELLNKLLSKFA
ncbi:MAG: MarR family transcriptional regulator [Eubacteriales bacterium]|nr:MarR family transcriptional regulator [Eubacteriales bacterium]